MKKTVLVKKFPRFEDPFCLGKQEKARSLRFPNAENRTSQGEISGRDNFVKSLSDPNTPKVSWENDNIAEYYELWLKAIDTRLLNN